MKWVLLAIVLYLLSVFAPLYYVWGAESDTESTGNQSMSQLAEQSRKRTDQKLSENSNQLPQNLNEQNQILLNPNNPWEDLRQLIDSGMQGLSESNEALTELETQLELLKAETTEQKRLLEVSRKLVISLKKSLAEAQISVDVAIDRMRDAEDYAVWISAQNEILKKEAEKMKRNMVVGWTVGSVSFGSGIPMMIHGIRTDNSTLTWAGVGVTAIPSAVWALGHFVFQWW